MKISLITAVFNARSTIQDTIASIAAQTYHNTEHIIVDGGSTDGTLEVINAHRQSVALLISEPDQGIYDALNKGLALAKGDVVGFLNADDVYASPDVLAKIAATFSSLPTTDAVYGDLVYVNKDDVQRIVRYWQSRQFSQVLLKWGWMPPHPTLYVRRKHYQHIGGFDIRYRIAADYLSILRLFSQNGFNAVYLPEVLVKMRLGGVSNRQLKNILLKSQEDLLALRQTNVGGILSLLWKNLSKMGQFFVKHTP